jgi:predicted nucleotidyltransferase
VAEIKSILGEDPAFLKELTKHEVKFIIIGLSAAALQGAPVVTQDIDLWFEDIGNPAIKKVLRKFGASLVPPIHMNPPRFAGKKVELFDIVLTVHGIKTFDEEYKNALDVSLGKYTVKVLPLERIIKSKEYMKRPKDLMALPVLKDVLETIRLKEKL